MEDSFVIPDAESCCTWIDSEEESVDSLLTLEIEFDSFHIL